MKQETQNKMAELMAKQMEAMKAKTVLKSAQVQPLPQPQPEVKQPEPVEEVKPEENKFYLPETEQTIELSNTTFDMLFSSIEPIKSKDSATYCEPMKYEPLTPEAPKTEEKKAECYIVDYSEKAIAVFGETKAIKEKLMELRGIYQPFLKGGKGWIFPKSKREKVEELLKHL